MKLEDSYRILAVDDSKAIQDDFRKILGADPESDSAHLDADEAALFGETAIDAPRTPFQMSFASQGQEAVALIQGAYRAGQRFSLVFMDVRMPPGWDGIETAVKLWEIDPDLQIVICTAYSDKSWEEMIAVVPHPERMLILKKPFDTIEVLQLAHALTEKWTLLQASRRNLEEMERTVNTRTQELQASEQRFRQLSDHAPIGIFETDAAGLLTYANSWLKAIMGLSLNETLADYWRKSVEPEDAAWILALWRKVIGEGAESNFEFRYRSATGDVHWLYVRSRPLRGETGETTGHVGSVEEVTERKQTEIALLRLAAIVEFSDDAIISKDLNSTVTSWNGGAERIFGYTGREMVGTSIMRLIPADRQEEENQILGKIRSGENVEHFETLRQTKDGRLINVSVTASPIKNAAGEPIGVSKVARDITERKRVEQKLTLLDTCISKLNDIVLVTEADPIDEPGPRIIFVNEAFERVTGYTSAEALGRSPRFLQGEKTDRHVLAEIRHALRLRQPIRRQILNYGKDGSEYWLEMDIVPIVDPSGKCTHFAAIERDITEAKKSEARYGTLFEYAPDGILIVDSQGVYLDANMSICRMLGYSREELVGLHSADIVAPAEIPHIEPALNEIISKADYHREWQFRRKDGSVFAAEVIATLMPDGHILAMIRDITERLRAAEQIAEQAAFLDKARDAILVRDLEGKILFWNQGAERMYGWTPQEVVGRNIGGLLYTNPKKFKEVNDLAISRGEWSGELQHLTKAGHEITIEARWTLIRDNDGKPKSVLAINTDVTEKKKIEAQFMRAQRMESIGTLAGGIAHDLNNILAPIMMSIDILKTMSENPQAIKILETIEVSSKRGADIVRQVLSFARGLEGERVEVQPKHLLKDLESIIKDTFPKDIQLRFTVPNDTWTILGDPTQIHQILLNLCVNARDAMPNGGRLTIGVENCRLDEQYAAMHPEAKPGRYVNITVTDTGMGIPHGILDKIFEPFFTTKDLNKGTGLGLSTVMAIVKSHDGVINVYSEPGKGTTFTVYLPAMAISSDAPQNTAELVSLPRGNGETVLVVDDEASILTITSQTLQAFGYRVLTAVDGAEAVAVYAQHRNEIAVVLTDMMMPVMDGPATIHALMRINPIIKIIAASGLTANGGVARVAGAGVNHFLTKPYTAGTLLKTMRTILDEA